MRIEGPGKVGNGVAGTRRAGTSAAFRLPEEMPHTSQSAAAMATSAPSLDALLALQSVETFPERRRRAVARGRNLLGALDEMRLGLLQGVIDPALPGRLQALLAEAHETLDEPDLDEVLEAVDLRAQVELAKLSRRESRGS